MRRNLTCLIILIMMLLSLHAPAQSRREIKNSFIEAESYFLFEEYKECLPIYLDLLEMSPENYNYMYRIGQCYLNIPEEKEKAIPYLEQATNDIDPKYREGKFRESSAPFDAYYYLANAYRINNQLDKAIDSYRRFYENMDYEVYDSVVVKKQLQACFNAKKLMKSPFWLEKENLGEMINSRFPDRTPVVSADGQTIVFNQEAQFQDFIFYARKTPNGWSAPIMMNFQLAIDQDIYPTSITDDGSELYLYYLDNQDGNIYHSTFEEERWTEAVKLNENINTKYWEAHATISHGNDKLYFSSNNELTTNGGLDIYVSERDSLGNWGPPRNLGPVINTRYHDNTPFLTQDDKTLYFSSRGHYNMGGYDVFYSTRFEDGDWSKPINVGYPLNTTDDDLFFTPMEEGYVAYYSLFPETGGYGSTDIYRVELFSEEHPRKFKISGIVTIPGLPAELPKDFSVTALKRPGMDTAAVTTTDPLTGEYDLELIQGEYDIVYEGEGFYTRADSLRLGLLQEKEDVTLDSTQMMVSDLVAELNPKDTIGELTLGDSVDITLEVEENSLLIVEKWKDSILIDTEHFEVYDSTFVYSYLAGEDIDSLQFRLRDRFGNESITAMPFEVIPPPPPVVIPRPEMERIVAQKKLQALLEKMDKEAEGPLKQVLRSMDVEADSMTTEEELFAKLREESLRRGIPEEELGELAVVTARDQDLVSIEALRYLAAYAEGPLKEALLSINPDESGIRTWNDLLEYLAAETQETGLTEQEISGFIAYALSEPDEEILLATEQMEKFGIPRYLQQVFSRKDLEYTGIKKAGEWLEFLIAATPDTASGPNHPLRLITSFAAGGSEDPELFLENLILNTDNAPLKAFLEKLDLKQEKIKTIHELVDHLLLQAEKEGFAATDVYETLMKMAVDPEVHPAEVREYWEKQQDKRPLWILWPLSLATLMILFIVLRRRRKKEN